MQGCPYDALYIDPRTETAAKCNFCAHKVEVGLEPPCVTVCPTQAIVAGDLDDPHSAIVASARAHPDPGAQAREGDAAQGLLHRGRRGRARPGRRAAALRLHVGAGAASPGAAPDRGGGRAAPHLRGARAAPQRLGLAGVGLPVDEVDRRGLLPGPRPPLAAGGSAAGGGVAGRALLPGADGAALDRGPAPAAPLPLDADEAAMAVLADPRVVRPRCVRGSPRRRLPLRPAPLRPSALRDRPDRAPRGLHRALHGLPLRSVQGARPLAIEPARSAPGRAGPGGRGLPVRLRLAALAPAPERPAGRGRDLGPPRHRGRPARRAPHPGGPPLHHRACSRSAISCPSAFSGGQGARARSRAASRWPDSSSGSTSTSRRPSRCRTHDDRAPVAGLLAPGLPARRALGRLARVRPARVAAAGGAPLLARPHDLLQLRGGVRPPGLRGPGDDAGAEVRGQPAAPRLAWPELREGAGHHQPDPGSGADPPSPAAGGEARGPANGAG